ncbi:MAG: hypothetical protein QOE75_1106 [Solirubrobacterales bacterium]|jgi:hypothetical protein|nr:hypothetical protein [Solirubrobacterales bacterium]
MNQKKGTDVRRNRRTILISFLTLFAVMLPGASAASAAQITGFSDENVAGWPGTAWAAFNNTGVKQVRFIIPWDTANNAGEVANVGAKISAAESQGLQVLISFNHSGATPPTAGQYLLAIIKFREKFPQISAYTAWNEPNHPVETANPHDHTKGQAVLAADYWVNLHQQCQAPKYGPTCTVAAGDFSERWNVKPYMEAYKKRIAEYGGLTPSVWAYHPYTSLNSGNGAQTQEIKDFLALAGTKPIWFTEAGGMVCERGVGYVGGSYNSALTHQNGASLNYLKLIDSIGARVHRAYYYFLSWQQQSQIACPSGSGAHWDSGLMDANGFVRPAFLTLFPQAVLPPSLGTGDAIGVRQRHATITGAVDPRGYHTYYRFEYGTTLSYGKATENIYVGFQPGAVGRQEVISGLQAGTTYHYRIVAFSSTGTSYGADKTFTTRMVPEPPSWAIRLNDGIQWLYYATGTNALKEWGWNGSSWVPGVFPGTMAPNSHPVVVRNPFDGAKWVYAVDSANSLIEWSWNGSAWNKGVFPGAVAPNTGAAVTYDEESWNKWVYHVNNEKKLKQWSWNGSSWAANTFPGTIAVNSTPVAIREPETDDQWIYTVNGSGSLIEWSWDGLNWALGGPFPGSVAPNSSPAVVRDPYAGTKWIYIVNGEGGITEWGWNGSNWSSGILSGPGTVKPGTSPTVVRDPYTGTKWVYFINPTGGITEWGWNGSAWSKGVFPGTNAKGNSAPVVVRDHWSGTKWLYYLNTAGGVTQWAWNGVSWNMGVLP